MVIYGAEEASGGKSDIWIKTRVGIHTVFRAKYLLHLAPRRSGKGEGQGKKKQENLPPPHPLSLTNTYSSNNPLPKRTPHRTSPLPTKPLRQTPPVKNMSRMPHTRTNTNLLPANLKQTLTDRANLTRLRLCRSPMRLFLHSSRNATISSVREMKLAS